MFEQLIGSHPDLASRMIVGRACVQAHFHQDYDVDALQVLDRLSAFRRVNELDFSEIMLLNVNDAFFRRCRDAGILSLTMGAQYEEQFTIEGLLEFFFGPTLAGLETVKRSVDEICFFEMSLFRRVLEVG